MSQKQKCAIEYALSAQAAVAEVLLDSVVSQVVLFQLRTDCISIIELDMKGGEVRGGGGYL